MNTCPKAFRWLVCCSVLLASLALAACGDDSSSGGGGGPSCDQLCALDMCPNDDAATCMSECQDGQRTCPNEFAAASNCTVANSASLMCDSFGETELPGNLCSNEVAALLVCALQNAGM